VLVEEFIGGKELTVAVLGEKSGPRPLAVTEIIPAGEWYDYNAKYAAGGSRHIIPAPIHGQAYAEAMRLAELAHQALGCRGVSRTDLRYDDTKGEPGRLVVLEVNTQPGMTPTSLVPEQAQHAGMSFGELVSWMVEDASCSR